MTFTLPVSADGDALNGSCVGTEAGGTSSPVELNRALS